MKHKIANVNEIVEGKGKKVVVDNLELGVFKVEGKIHAIENVCTHAGASLSEGIVEGKEVICPLHAWKFDVTNGKCNMFDGAPNVKHFEVTVENDEVFVEI